MTSEMPALLSEFQLWKSLDEVVIFLLFYVDSILFYRNAGHVGLLPMQ